VTRAFPRWLQSSWPVRTRTPLLPLPTDYSANAIHTFAPNNWAGMKSGAWPRKHAFEWLAGGCLGTTCDPVLVLEVRRWQTVPLPLPNHAPL
jgi:hypothetical protein